ncbi:MAG: helix-turn-helix domain-containing protein [Anaeroplasmataceae bacterium]
MQIGTKIKELRLENGLTQEELANRVELTKGYISQLENNLTSPSIETLMDILEILGTNLSDFFSNSDDEKIAFKKEEFFEKQDTNLKHTISWIIPNALKYEMEPIIIDIEPGGKSFVDEPHPGEEFGYVLEGEIQLVLGKRKLIIKQGETFYFRASQSHYILNITKKIARVLWVSTPPMF